MLPVLLYYILLSLLSYMHVLLGLGLLSYMLELRCLLLSKLVLLGLDLLLYILLPLCLLLSELVLFSLGLLLYMLVLLGLSHMLVPVLLG